LWRVTFISSTERTESAMLAAASGREATLKRRTESSERRRGDWEARSIRWPLMLDFGSISVGGMGLGLRRDTPYSCQPHE
jgi:hypothetical protein